MTQHLIERWNAEHPVTARLWYKIVIVTRAASGIGLGIATRFAAEGASLIVGDRHVEHLDKAVAQIRECGGTIIGTPGDISERAAAEHLVDLAIETYGRTDVLVNNAGVMDYM